MIAKLLLIGCIVTDALGVSPQNELIDAALLVDYTGSMRYFDVRNELVIASSTVRQVALENGYLKSPRFSMLSFRDKPPPSWELSGSIVKSATRANYSVRRHMSLGSDPSQLLTAFDSSYAPVGGSLGFHEDVTTPILAALQDPYLGWSGFSVDPETGERALVWVPTPRPTGTTTTTTTTTLEVSEEAEEEGCATYTSQEMQPLPSRPMVKSCRVVIAFTDAIMGLPADYCPENEGSRKCLAPFEKFDFSKAADYLPPTPSQFLELLEQEDAYVVLWQLGTTSRGNLIASSQTSTLVTAAENASRFSAAVASGRLFVLSGTMEQHVSGLVNALSQCGGFDRKPVSYVLDDGAPHAIGDADVQPTVVGVELLAKQFPESPTEVNSTASPRWWWNGVRDSSGSSRGRDSHSSSRRHSHSSSRGRDSHSSSRRDSSSSGRHHHHHHDSTNPEIATTIPENAYTEQEVQPPGTRPGTRPNRMVPLEVGEGSSQSHVDASSSSSEVAEGSVSIEKPSFSFSQEQNRPKPLVSFDLPPPLNAIPDGSAPPSDGSVPVASESIQQILNQVNNA